MSGGSWFRADGTRFDTAKLRRRWKSGCCVCCGMLLGVDVKAIAEGVQICGMCHACGHLGRPDELEAVLRALLPAAGG
jgi:hypothetical protein